MKTRDYEKIGLPKRQAEEIADRLIEWFENCLKYLAFDNWAFAVSPEGKYLPGTWLATDRPKAFLHDQSGWQFRLLPPFYPIQHVVELNRVRNQTHKNVTITLWRLIGPAGTNTRLEKIRETHKLPKITRSKKYGFDI